MGWHFCPVYIVQFLAATFGILLLILLLLLLAFYVLLLSYYCKKERCKEEICNKLKCKADLADIATLTSSSSLS